MSDAKSKDKMAVSVVIPAELLERVDDRAEKLDLTRSQYLRQLVRKDLADQPAAESHVEQSQPVKVAA